MIALTVALGAGAGVTLITGEDHGERGPAVVADDPAVLEGRRDAYRRAAEVAAREVCASGCDAWRVLIQP